MVQTSLPKKSLAVLIAVATATATTTADVEYTVIDLGIPPGAFESLATGINTAGEVTGWSGNTPGSPFFRAWKWSPATGLTVLPDIVLPNGDENYVATDINDGGVIAGDGSWSGTGGRGWRFENGTYSILPLLPGDTWSILTGINAGGAVAGFSDDFSPGGLTEEYFFHSDLTGLVLIPESHRQIANLGRLNDAGQVVGTMSGAGAFRWTVDGGFEFLAPPPAPFNAASAWGINDAGHVCGMLFEDDDKHGAVYIDGAWQSIADFALAGCCSDPRTERGEAVNASGIVAGWSALTGGSISGAHIAWVWSEAAGARLLDDLIDPALNVHLRKALDINDAGQIVAYGSDGDLPEPYRAYLLTPISPADLDGDGAVAVGDLLLLLAAWGPCGSCTEDLDGDALVGVLDLLMLLASWS